MAKQRLKPTKRVFIRKRVVGFCVNTKTSIICFFKRVLFLVAKLKLIPRKSVSDSTVDGRAKSNSIDNYLQRKTETEKIVA